MTERTQPHDLQAEKSVLGAILLQNDRLSDAAEVLEPSDFYRKAHEILYAKMLAMHVKGIGIDLVTLMAALDARERDVVQGPAYVSSLADGLPRGSNVTYYAGIVKSHAIRRGLIRAAEQALDEAYRADTDAAELLDEAEHRMFALADKQIKTGFVRASSLLPATFARFEHAANRRGMLTGIPTGFERLDELTHGLQPSELILIAARPSIGKTSLALNLALHAAVKAQKTVAIFSIEMTREELMFRFVTGEGQIDAHRARQGYLSDVEYRRLSDAMGVMDDAPIFLDDTSNVTLLTMRAKARRLKAEHGLDLVIIDYIQLMRSTRKAENRNLEVSAISAGLKALAKDLRVPVVALSQLSRAPEARGDKQPQLADLRDSGSLEQDADTVLLLHRPGHYKPTKGKSSLPMRAGLEQPEEDESMAEVIIAKQRNGPTGIVKLRFDKQYTRFVDPERRTA